MKRLVRMIFFSGLAVYFTSLWNKGFIINNDLLSFIKISLIIAFLYYLIIPISKIFLLPLNIITFGLISTVFYALFFYFFFMNFDLILIKSWNFEGVRFLNFIINPFEINYIFNIFLSAFSIATIINLLEKNL